MRSIGPRRACDSGQMSGGEAHAIAGQHTAPARESPGPPLALHPAPLPCLPPLLRICPNLASGGKHFRPEITEHKSVASTRQRPRAFFVDFEAETLRLEHGTTKNDDGRIVT
jgi:hypothetical protein